MKQDYWVPDFNHRPHENPISPWEHLENLSWVIARMKESDSSSDELQALMALRSDMASRCEFTTMQVDWECDTLIVLPRGGLDVQSSRGLQSELQQLGTLRPKLLILDCSQLTGIVSTLIGVILQIQNMLARNNGQVVMVKVNNTIREALESARITQFVPIAESVGKARTQYEERN